MELSDAIRYYVEENGIEKVPELKFYWWISDLAKTESLQYKYILRSSGFKNLFKKLIDTTGDENCVVQLSFNYSRQTGFQQDLISKLLTELSWGIMKAFWGKYPDENGRFNLIKLYTINKKEWQIHLNFFKKTTFLIKKDFRNNWINENGEEIFSSIPGFIVMKFSEGLSYVRDYKGYINLRGNLEINTKDLIPDRKMNESSSRGAGFGNFKNGFVQYTYDNKKYGIINNQGQKTEDIYEDFDRNIRDYIFVKKDSLWGLLDLNFNYIIEHKYDYIKYLSKNIYIVKDNNSYFLIEPGKKTIYLNKGLDFLFDKNSEILIIHKFHFHQFRNYIYNLKGELLTVSFKNENKIINYPVLSFNSQGYCLVTNNKEREKKYFDYIFPYSEGHAWIKNGYFWKLINEKEEIISVTNKFEILGSYFHEGTLARNSVSGNICVINQFCEILNQIPNSCDLIPPKSHDLWKFNHKNINYIYYCGILKEISAENYIISQFNSYYPYIEKGKKLVISKLDNQLLISELNNNNHIYNIPVNSKENFEAAYFNKSGKYIIIKDSESKHKKIINLNDINNHKIIKNLEYNFEFTMIVEDIENNKNFINNNLNIISENFKNIEAIIDNYIIVSNTILVNKITNYIKKVEGLYNTKGSLIIPLEYEKIIVQNPKDLDIKPK